MTVPVQRLVVFLPIEDQSATHAEVVEDPVLPQASGSSTQGLLAIESEVHDTIDQAEDGPAQGPASL